ncbi:MAG TPA: hypothetical protein VHA13_05485 [Gammaproteobacteria bacterium]|nr:hypothetical protein [Gammaproteobacteria bacterium]
MGLNKSNNSESAFKNNEKWSDLPESDKKEIVWSYRSHGDYFNNKSRTISDLLYNWLFILNSGGLVSLVTLLTSKFKECKAFKLGMMHMGISFIAGLILIYIATKLSKWQTHKKGENLDKDFLLLTNDQISLAEFEKRIYSDIFPRDFLITIIEFLSLTVFIIGLVKGFKIVS